MPILFRESNEIPQNIYLSDPLPSLPKYLMSWSPTESLLWSSDGKLWLLQTSSMGSDLTLSFMRFGGDGVRLSLSVDDEDNPLPFDALLLLKLFGSAGEKEAFLDSIVVKSQLILRKVNGNVLVLRNDIKLFPIQSKTMWIDWLIRTVWGVVFGAFGIFHGRRVVVVVFDGGEIGSGDLWHVTDDIWTVVVTIVGPLAFQWQLFLTGIVAFATQCSCSCCTSQ